jgi:hypothetical protein
MTQHDFRALCAELVTAFKDESTYTQRVEILDRANIALATPPPEPPPLQLKRRGGYQPLAHSSKTISPPRNP